MHTISVEIKINDEIIQDVINNFNDWMGITATESHVHTILDNNLDIAKDLEEMGGVDTLAREDLANCFCRDVLGMFPWSWPSGSMNAYYKFEFYEQLIAKCKEKDVTSQFNDEWLQEELIKWQEQDEKRKQKS